jgi:hypothetical protein
MMRIKSHWFRDGEQKSPAEQASAMAFIAWRVAQNMLKRMRSAGFDIDIGPPYFGFTREVLVFLAQVIDRMAAAALSPDDRIAFTTELVRRMAALVDENEREYLGAAPADGPGWDDSFIEQCNVLGGHYAEFGGHFERAAVSDTAPAPAIVAFHPDFGFVRYLGSRLDVFMPPKDRHWVIDQVIAIEVPEAVATVQRGLRDLFDPQPRPARRGGHGGD